MEAEEERGGGFTWVPLNLCHSDTLAVSPKQASRALLPCELCPGKGLERAWKSMKAAGSERGAGPGAWVSQSCPRAEGAQLVSL